MKELRPMKAIRANCLDCSGSAKAVAYCTCDGVHGTRCYLMATPIWLSTRNHPAEVWACVVHPRTHAWAGCGTGYAPEEPPRLPTLRPKHRREDRGGQRPCGSWARKESCGIWHAYGHRLRNRRARGPLQRDATSQFQTEVNRTCQGAKQRI